MHKLTFLLVILLTSVAPTAWAAGVPAPVPQAESEPLPPSPEVEPASEHQELQHASVRRFERTELREELAADRRAASVPPHLQAIAQCESGGDPGAVGGGGQFRGKYQFTYSTWAAVGGQGDPATAPEAEQDRRAAALYAQSGPGQWPVCAQ